MTHRILIVDDDPDMAHLASDLLKKEGYAVRSFTDPIAALDDVRSHPPDLLLLDIVMPGMNGLEVCRQLKREPKTSHVGILMISVKYRESDVVTGLELGADDYLKKPYRKRELLARVRAVIRRKEPQEKAAVIEKGPLRLDFGAHAVTLNGTRLEMAPKEFELLGLFMSREGRVLTRAAISDHVWKTPHLPTSRTIDYHVNRVRRHIQPYGHWIQALTGIGYRFESDGEPNPTHS